jgi:Putative lactococcus lactis phage r1t holin
MLTAAFWTGLLDRAIKTFLQTLLVLWTGDVAFNVLTVDWPASLSVAASATVISIITSFLSSAVAEKGTTSFLPGGK